MAYKASDAGFVDGEQLSEISDVQIYEASKPHKRAQSRKASPATKAKKPAAKPQRPAARTESVSRANRVPAKSDLPVKRSTTKPAQPKQKKTGGEVVRSAGHGLVDILKTKGDSRVKTIKNRRRNPFPISAVVMSGICTVLLMFMIFSYVQINEYTVKVSDLRDDVSVLVDQDKELTLALEKKNDMLLIEEKAGELGMVKVDQLTKKQVSLTQDDKIEVVEPEPTEDSTVVTTIMSSIWQNFSGLWEYLG